MLLRCSDLHRLCLVLTVFCVLYLYYYLKYPQAERFNKSSEPNTKDFKYILTWSDAYNDPLYGWPHIHEDGFQLAGCEESRCHLTSNRSYLGNTFNVLFSVQSC